MAKRKIEVENVKITFTTKSKKSKWGWGKTNIAEATWIGQDLFKYADREDWASDDPNVEFTAALYNLHEHFEANPDQHEAFFHGGPMDFDTIRRLVDVAEEVRRCVEYRLNLPLYVIGALDKTKTQTS
ncbi:hypothetical protein [Roseinatronobacter sp.]|uniref:hypothetical protein n=1 Tax=Roseinatronobacter sp. TaxID=1945755 RepID=UPI0025EC11AA|nr:hypothetical protein [Roseibaca sp.]